MEGRQDPGPGVKSGSTAPLRPVQRLDLEQPDQPVHPLLSVLDVADGRQQGDHQLRCPRCALMAKPDLGLCALAEVSAGCAGAAPGSQPYGRRHGATSARNLALLTSE